MSRPRFMPALSTALLAAVVTATGAWAARGSGSRTHHRKNFSTTIIGRKSLLG